MNNPAPSVKQDRVILLLTDAMNLGCLGYRYLVDWHKRAKNRCVARKDVSRLARGPRRSERIADRLAVLEGIWCYWGGKTGIIEILPGYSTTGKIPVLPSATNPHLNPMLPCGRP